MQTRVATGFAAFVLIAAAVAAQSSPRGTSTHAAPAISKKIIKATGCITDGGKTFVADRDHVAWRITNPDAVAAATGMRVVLRVRLDAENHEMEVASVRVNSVSGAHLTATAVLRQDAAFRR